MSETEVPCLICGKQLEQVLDGCPMQPSDGIYCETAGNYGSTVWDSQDGERLVFLICDACLASAGQQGRVMTYRKARPIVTDEPGFRVPAVVGWEELPRRGTVRWHSGLPRDDEPLYLSRDELAALPVRQREPRTLNLPLEGLS